MFRISDLILLSKKPASIAETQSVSERLNQLFSSYGTFSLIISAHEVSSLQFIAHNQDVAYEFKLAFKKLGNSTNNLKYQIEKLLGRFLHYPVLHQDSEKEYFYVEKPTALEMLVANRALDAYGFQMAINTPLQELSVSNVAMAEEKPERKESIKFSR